MTDRINEGLLQDLNAEEHQNNAPLAEERQPFEEYLASVSLAKMPLPEGENLPEDNRESFAFFLSGIVQAKGAVIPKNSNIIQEEGEEASQSSNIIQEEGEEASQSSNSISALPSLRILSHGDSTLNNQFWVIESGMLHRMKAEDASVESIFAALNEGKTLVLPQPCFSEEDHEFLGYDYNNPLVLNASKFNGSLYFHLCDAKDAYALGQQEIPQYPNLHWYDHVLDFFAKFFGCRREICEEWDKFQEQSTMRSKDTIDLFKQAFQVGRTFPNFETNMGVIPYASKLRLNMFVDIMTTQEQKRALGPTQEKPTVKRRDDSISEQLPDEKPLNIPEDKEEQREWFKSQYEQKKKEEQKEEAAEFKNPGKAYLQLLSSKKKEEQKQLNAKIHNNFLNKTQKHYFQREFLSSHGGEISLSAAYFTALAFGVAESLKLENADNEIHAFLLGEPHNLPDNFQQLFENVQSNPQNTVSKKILAKGILRMWEGVIKQEDMLSPWSLQLAGMATRLKAALTKRRTNPDQHLVGLQVQLKPNNTTRELEEIYSGINNAERCALPKDLGKNKEISQEEAESAYSILEGQVNYAFLCRLNKVPQNERIQFIANNNNAYTALKIEMSSDVINKLSGYDDPAQALLNGNAIYDYQKNRIPENELDTKDISNEDLIDISKRAIQTAQNKKAPEKKKKNVGFKDDLEEVIEVKSFKKENKANTQSKQNSIDLSINDYLIQI
ncbi:MAG: hypothetical protein Q4B50_00215 [Bacillota bacterium]|nr:hypothetical protein [Bacillota bacterium]